MDKCSESVGVRHPYLTFDEVSMLHRSRHYVKLTLKTTSKHGRVLRFELGVSTFCRGEKAFCSWDCRSQEILMEEVDNAFNASRDCVELSETGMFIDT